MCTSHTARRPRFLFPPPSSRRVPRGIVVSAVVAELEKGTRPWTRPWSAEHAGGRLTRPLRHNGQLYSGINILSLWASASVQGFAAPMWMT